MELTTKSTVYRNRPFEPVNEVFSALASLGDKLPITILQLEAPMVSNEALSALIEQLVPKLENLRQCWLDDVGMSVEQCYKLMELLKDSAQLRDFKVARNDAVLSDQECKAKYLEFRNSR